MCFSSASIPCVCCTAMSILRISDVCVSMRMPMDDDEDCSAEQSSRTDQNRAEQTREQEVSARPGTTSLDERRVWPRKMVSVAG